MGGQGPDAAVGVPSSALAVVVRSTRQHFDAISVSFLLPGLRCRTTHRRYELDVSH